MPAPDTTSPMVNGLWAGINPGSTAAAALLAAMSALLGGNPGGSFAGRRRTINGDMRIDQANAGAAVVVNAAGPLFGPDKWTARGTAAAGVFSIQQQAGGPPGFTNFLRTTVTTADAAPAAASIYFLRHVIEGNYCQDLQMGVAGNAQSLSIGLWVRSSLTGIFSGALSNGAGTRSFVITFNIPAANVWTFIPLVIPADQAGVWTTDNSNGITFVIDLGSGVNARNATVGWQAGNVRGQTGAVSLLATNGATFDLTGVQLEPGTISTPYEQKPLGDELRLCQREFHKSFNQATVPAQNVGVNTGEYSATFAKAGALSQSLPNLPFPVVMRAVPAVTLYNPAAANAQFRDESAAADCSGSATNNISDRNVGFATVGNAGSTAGNLFGVHYTADARL